MAFHSCPHCGPILEIKNKNVVHCGVCHEKLVIVNPGENLAQYLDNIQCATCKKLFRINKKSGRVACGHCNERLTISLDEAVLLQPTTNNLLKLFGFDVDVSDEEFIKPDKAITYEPGDGSRWNSI